MVRIFSCGELLFLGQSLGSNLQVGTTEGIDANTDIGRLVTPEAHDMTGIFLGAEAFDGDFLANGIVGGGKLDLRVLIAQHELQLVHLLVRDRGKGALLMGTVDEKAADERFLHQSATLYLRDVDEDILRNDHPLDLLLPGFLTVAILVEPVLFL